MIVSQSAFHIDMTGMIQSELLVDDANVHAKYDYILQRQRTVLCIRSEHGPDATNSNILNTGFYPIVLVAILKVS